MTARQLPDLMGICLGIEDPVKFSESSKVSGFPQPSQRSQQPADKVGEDWIKWISPEMSDAKLDEALHYIDGLTQEYSDGGMPKKSPEDWSKWFAFNREYRKYYDDQYGSIWDASSVYSQAEDYITQAKNRAIALDKKGWKNDVVKPEVEGRDDNNKPVETRPSDKPLAQVSSILGSAVTLVGIGFVGYLVYQFGGKRRR